MNTNKEKPSLSNNPIYSIEELEQFEKLALSQHDETIHAEMFIKSFHYYYDAGQITKAFDYLLLGISFLEKKPVSELKKDLLLCAVKAATFFVSIPNSTKIIKATIAQGETFENSEILSMCFYLLSNEALKNGQFTEAISYAKMAHYYALKIQSNRLFYECNAQLQLVCALLETAEMEEAKKYIDTFGWYIEHCKNDQEKVLVVAIQATVSFLQNEQEAALLTMNALMTRMLDSKEVMYSSYLAMHFKRVLRKSSEQNEALLELISLCDAVVERFTYEASNSGTSPSQSIMISAQQFYIAANEFVSQLGARNEQGCILKFKNAESVLEVNHLLDAKEIPYVIHQYLTGRFVLVTTDNGQKIIEDNDTIRIIESITVSAAKQETFFELYNELNLKILMKNAEKLTTGPS